MARANCARSGPPRPSTCPNITAKKRIKDDALRLKQLDPFIGSLELRQVHMGNLQAFIARRRQDGVKTKTLNMALAVVRRVLNLASSEWMDRAGKTWLETAPKIKLFPIKDARPPYPLSLETSVFIITSAEDFARQACPSRIVKIRSGTEVVASRRTTPKPN
jgi:hypothetical protein